MNHCTVFASRSLEGDVRNLATKLIVLLGVYVSANYFPVFSPLLPFSFLLRKGGGNTKEIFVDFIRDHSTVFTKHLECWLYIFLFVKKFLRTFIA